MAVDTEMSPSRWHDVKQWVRTERLDAHKVDGRFICLDMPFKAHDSGSKLFGKVGEVYLPLPEETLHLGQKLSRHGFVCKRRFYDLRFRVA